MTAEEIARRIENTRYDTPLPSRPSPREMCLALGIVIDVLRPLAYVSSRWRWLHRRIPGYIDLDRLIVALETYRAEWCPSTAATPPGAA